MTTEKTLIEKVEAMITITNVGGLSFVSFKDGFTALDILEAIKADGKREKELAKSLEGLRDHDEDKTPLCGNCKAEREIVIAELTAADNTEAEKGGIHPTDEEVERGIGTIEALMKREKERLEKEKPVKLKPSGTLPQNTLKPFRK